MTVNEGIPYDANPHPTTNELSSDNPPLVIPPSTTNTLDSDTPSMNAPTSIDTYAVAVHSTSVPSYTGKDLSVLAGEVGESDSQDDDYEIPKRRYKSKSQKEIMNKQMELARMKKREKT